MGLFKMSGGGEYTQYSPPPAPNPNPWNFKINWVEQVGSYWLASIKYPGCTTFEGLKLMILNTNPERLTSLDPHFTKDGYVVARFPHTVGGIYMAKQFLEMLA